MKDKNSIIILSIVAVVAVVAIIFLIIGSNKSQLLESKNSDTFGNAISVLSTNQKTNIESYAFDAPTEKVAYMTKINSKSAQNLPRISSKNGQVISVYARDSNNYAMVSNTGFKEFKGLSPVSGDRVIQIDFTGRTDIDSIDYSLLILGTTKNGELFHFEYHDAHNSEPIFINAPEGLVNLYFRAYTLTYNINDGYLTLHEIYDKTSDSSGKVVLNLNNPKKLSQNFNDIAAENNYDITFGFSSEVIFQKYDGWSSFWFLSENIKWRNQFYAPNDISMLQNNFVYKNYLSGTPNYLILDGDFYPGDTTIPKDIKLDPRNIKTTTVNAESQSHQMPKGFKPFQFMGSCYTFIINYESMACIAWGKFADYPVIISYMDKKIVWLQNFYTDTDLRKWLFMQENYYGLNDITPHSLTFFKSPLNMKIEYSKYDQLLGSSITGTLTTGDINAPNIKWLPNNVKIALKLPNGNTKYGNGDFYLNCYDPQNSNPPIDNCIVGNYSITINLTDVIKNGTKIFNKTVYYNGNKWII